VQPESEELRGLIAAVLNRFLAQNAEKVPPAEVATVAGQLAAVLEERASSAALQPEATGTPNAIADSAIAAVLARVLSGTTHTGLADPARQLVKSCLYPELAVCRDSFREVASDGSCRRQDESRARRRISGAHCVDCPYWQRYSPAEHAEFLAAHWRTGRAEFNRCAAIFLPGDFRALRRCVRKWTGSQDARVERQPR
jgi:hypothetical protein